MQIVISCPLPSQSPEIVTDLLPVTTDTSVLEFCIHGIKHCHIIVPSFFHWQNVCEIHPHHCVSSWLRASAQWDRMKWALGDHRAAGTSITYS